MNNNKKVVVLYRVIQEWRRPVFERLSQVNGIDFKLLHGPDFKNSKVVNTKKKVNFKSDKLLSLKLRGNSKNGLIAMPVSPFLFFRLIKENPDVIITEGASNLFNALIGFIYCKLLGKKFIWWSLGRLKGTVHSGFRKFIDSLIKYIERNADAIISYSSFGKTYFNSIGVEENRIFVAVNVIDTEAKSREIDLYKGGFQKYNNKFTILFVGALTKYKKIDLLIKAFARFNKDDRETELIIVGDGEDKESLIKLSKELHVDNITFTGRVFDGVSKYFLESDVFVLPGLGGLAISEAMLHGLPVIASIGDGCEKDLIENNVNGIIDENLDEERLVSYLVKLSEDRAFLDKLKLEAKRCIDEKYNINTYLAKIVQAIDYV